MYQNETDQFNDDKSVNKDLINLKYLDRGYNRIYRTVVRESDGRNVRKKIEIYTTGCTGSNIRDAETGEYYNELVGSRYEDLYFKVSLATGECTSLNGSNVLFYLSPQHYENHLNVELSKDTISEWEEKKERMMYEIKNATKKNRAVVVK